MMLKPIWRAICIRAALVWHATRVIVSLVWRLRRAMAALMIVGGLTYLISEGLFGYLTKYVGLDRNSLLKTSIPLTLGTCFAVCDKVISYISRLWNHAWTTSPMPSIGDSLSTVLTLANFAVAIMAFLLPRKPFVEVVPGPNGMMSVAFGAEPSIPLTVVYFPTVRGNNWQNRMDIPEPGAKRLKEIAQTVAFCSHWDTSTDIRLTIVGFASDLPFRDGNSDELNLEAANRRADRVAEFLRGGLKVKATSAVSVEPIKWKDQSIDKMREARRSLPHRTDLESKDQDFDRAAAIKIEGIGRCPIRITGTDNDTVGEALRLIGSNPGGKGIVEGGQRLNLFDNHK